MSSPIAEFVSRLMTHSVAPIVDPSNRLLIGRSISPIGSLERSRLKDKTLGRGERYFSVAMHTVAVGSGQGSNRACTRTSFETCCTDRKFL